MTMNQIENIEYDPTDYEVVETQNMDPELTFKMVKFTTGYYGIILIYLMV